MDDKWDEVFGSLLPEAAGHIAGRLGLSDPEAIAFAPSTHALVMRILSSLSPPVRILTTDAEFHSFARQAARLEEDGLAAVERVPAEPFATFSDRFAAAARRGGHDLVYLSHVFFNSGFVVPDLAALVAAVPEPEPLVVIDGYHGFMALPTDLSALERRAFYLAGGYKYAMAGEGACFAHCPPGYAERPATPVGSPASPSCPAGRRGRWPTPPAAGGSSAPPSTRPACTGFNAVQRWLDGLGVTVADIHDHVGALQARFLAAGPHPELLPDASLPERGHFLTFRLPDAAAVHASLHAAGVIADYRDDRLRIGFGLYHGHDDIDELVRRLATVPGWP